MKDLIVCDDATVARLLDRLKQARTRSEFQRVQCVLMRLTIKCSAAQIALVLGWAVTTVHAIHSRWAKEGEAIFEVRSRGGRHNQNLTVQDEAELLKPFFEQFQAGDHFTVKAVQQAYEERVGMPVAPSTVYRMLVRHGWRKKSRRALKARFTKNGEVVESVDEVVASQF